MSWTLNTHSPTDLGISQLRLQHANLADGSFTFSAPAREVDKDFLFGFNEVMTLRDTGNGVRWIGPCTKRPVAGSPGAESHQYTVSSPWWYLEQLPYLQEWTMEGGASTAWLGRCILGVALDGTRLTIGETVTGILDYALACGVPVRAGDIDLPGLFPVEEVKGLMCAEVIRRILRWAPDAVSWWAFATPQSSLNIQRRSALMAPAPLVVGAAPLHSVNVNPREDIPPSQVVLVYERTDTVDGVGVPTAVIDAMPPGSDGRALGALLYTIPLAGGSVTTLKQSVKTTPIEDTTVAGGADGNRTRRYWGRKFGLIGLVPNVPGASPATPAIQFRPLDDTEPTIFFERILAHPDGEDDDGAYELKDPEDPASDKIRLNAALPRELIGGAIASWMVGVTTQKQKCHARIAYLRTDGGTPAVQDIWIDVMATDATTRTYSKIQTQSEGETVAAGLAAQMFAALRILHYQGSIELLEEECGGQWGLGSVVNIQGGRPEWETMGAVIQEVTENLDAGQTTLTVGPPEHLAPQDRIELMRCDRRPEGATGNKDANVGIRQTGTL